MPERPAIAAEAAIAGDAAMPSDVRCAAARSAGTVEAGVEAGVDGAGVEAGNGAGNGVDDGADDEAVDDPTVDLVASAALPMPNPGAPDATSTPVEPIGAGVAARGAMLPDGRLPADRGSRGSAAESGVGATSTVSSGTPGAWPDALDGAGPVAVSATDVWPVATIAADDAAGDDAAAADGARPGAADSSADATSTGAAAVAGSVGNTAPPGGCWPVADKPFVAGTEGLAASSAAAGSDPFAGGSDPAVALDGPTGELDGSCVPVPVLPRRSDAFAIADTADVDAASIPASLLAPDPIDIGPADVAEMSASTDAGD